jgi:hypothetical protein
VKEAGRQERNPPNPDPGWGEEVSKDRDPIQPNPTHTFPWFISSRNELYQAHGGFDTCARSHS